jgi:flavin-dependent dehydrogenase
MKVAIMGAGLSGLSCALMLEQNGIEPHIYENRSQVGDRFVNGEIILSVLSHPQRDFLAYLADQYQIYLHPIAHIGKLAVFSENEKAELHGQLGFSTTRGRDNDSLEKQLERQVKSKIHFKSKRSYEELLEEYTHVVLATGDGAHAEAMKNYHTDLTVSLKGATVEGNFDRYTVAAWLDNRFAPQGYCYFIPFSEHEATLVIAYPDYPENRQKDQPLWEDFFRRASLDLGQDLHITDNFEITRYKIGLCDNPRIGNTFFTGNCFGAIMPFLGFGQYPALLTGIYAAMDLCGQGDYNHLTKHLRDSYQYALTLRRALEKLDNAKLDRLVQGLKTDSAERLLNTRYNFLKAAAGFLRPFVRN